MAVARASGFLPEPEPGTRIARTEGGKRGPGAGGESLPQLSALYFRQ